MSEEKVRRMSRSGDKLSSRVWKWIAGGLLSVLVFSLGIIFTVMVSEPKAALQSDIKKMTEKDEEFDRRVTKIETDYGHIIAKLDETSRYTRIAERTLTRMEQKLDDHVAKDK